MEKKDLLPKSALEIFPEYKLNDSKSARELTDRVEKIRKKYESKITFRLKEKNYFGVPRINNHPKYAYVIRSINESTKLLDAGCGCGWDLRRVIKDGLRIENAKGIDIEPLLKKINFELYRDEETMGNVFEIGDALSTRFESDSFDIIHSGSVMHILGERDKVVNYLQEIYRIIKKPGGIFFGRTLGDDSEKEIIVIGDPVVKTERNIYVSTPEKLKELLTNLGFKEIDIEVEKLIKEHLLIPSYMLHFFAKT
jgi:SAM-dependent methyltransferase